MAVRAAPLYNGCNSKKETQNSKSERCQCLASACVVRWWRHLKRRREAAEGFRPTIDRLGGQASLEYLPCNYSRGPAILHEPHCRHSTHSRGDVFVAATFAHDALLLSAVCNADTPVPCIVRPHPRNWTTLLHDHHPASGGTVPRTEFQS